jgi:hypothetical protein
MPRHQCHLGLDDRCRDINGEIRRKNGNLVRTLRQTYGDGFAVGFRGDMKLDTLISRSGTHSLSQYLRQSRPRE